MFKLKRYIIFIVLLAITTKAYGLNESNFLDARLEIGASFGKFIGVKESYQELGLFIPQWFMDEWLLFADSRGYHFNDSKWGLSTPIFGS